MIDIDASPGHRYLDFYLLHTMVSSRSTKPHQVVREDSPSGDGGEGCGPERGPSSVTTRGPKSRASRKATSTQQKGKQPERCRNVGRLSKLPDMSLDILSDVSYRVTPVTDEMDDDAVGIRRYSLLSTQWTYCAYHGPTRPFTVFSQVLEMGLGSRLRENPRDSTATSVS